MRTFEPIKPGIYLFKVAEENPGFSKTEGKVDKNKPRVEVVLHCQDEKYKNAPLWDYLTFGEGYPRRHLDNYLQCLGHDTKAAEKGEWDSDEHIGMLVKVSVRPDTNQSGEYKARVGNYIPAPQDQNEPGADVSETGGGGSEAPDLDALGESADGGDDEAAATLTDLAEANDLDPNAYDTWAELAEELKPLVNPPEEEEPAPAQKAAGTKKAAAKVASEPEEPDLDDLADKADNQDDGEAAATLTDLAEAAGVDPNDYATWQELADVLKPPEAEEPAPAKKAVGKKAAAVKKAAASTDEDYNSWEVPKLREELKARELDATGPKPTLVKRLQDNDEAPF